MNRVLVTGATGFIGRALCSQLTSDHMVIGVYHKKRPVNAANIVWEQADLIDFDSVAAICEKCSPDVVIHCAGVAHQKIGVVDSATYTRVNSEGTANLAEAVSKSNPDVCFIFLSSVSVYGEGPQIAPVGSSGPTGRAQKEKDASRKGAKTQREKNELAADTGLSEMDDESHETGRFSQKKKNSNNGVREDNECQPSSDYAFSKLDAERRLIALSDEGIIRDLIILRLAPVYDRDWSFNLDRRVLAPMKMAYIKFGSGLQKMSALARPNLVDFIEFLIRRLHPGEICSAFHRAGRLTRITDKAMQQNNPCNQRDLQINIFNVCDAEAYEFNTIIQGFKKSSIRPDRPVIPVPLPVIWLATRTSGCLFPDKRKWLHSCYDKVASSLVFNNEKMLKTGFKPVHSLETIFQSATT